MDAPPDKEALGPFVSVAQTLKGIGLNVPVILARDLRHGFLLLSDLGTRQYLDELVAGARGRSALRRCAWARSCTMQTRGARGGARAAALRPHAC